MKNGKRTLAILAAVAAVTIGSMSASAEAWNGCGGRDQGHRMHHDGQTMRGFGHGMNRWGDDLSLSAKQKLEMGDIERKWFDDNSELARKTAWALRDYRYDLSAGRNIDEGKVAEMKKDMVALETKRMELHRDLYGLLDGDQKKLADKRHQEGPFRRGDDDRGKRPGRSGRNEAVEKARADNWKAMDALRDEIHAVMTGNASADDLATLAEKKVEIRLQMIENMGKERFQMRKDFTPGDRDGSGAGKGGARFDSRKRNG